jgi:hypothetical protein
VLWGLATGKSRHGQVEATPKEMDGTAFTDEGRTELMEQAIDLTKDLPELLNVVSLI